jgi:basic membrane protein A
MSRAQRFLSVAAAFAAAPGVLVAATAGAERLADTTVCVVADPAGFDDNAFNTNVLAGADEASKKLQVDLITADPGTEAGIAAVVDAWAASGECDLIIGVGFIAGIAMEDSLLDYPAQRFAVIDYVFQTQGNAVSVTFRADQAAFLAGYVAAASSTGRVGTFGALPFPSVTDYMNGYALGVEYFNARTGNAVEVLGWDLENQTGLFSGSFSDPALGFSLADDLFAQGADTVFPVAGGTSVGAYEAAVQRKLAGEEVRIVYPDFDAYATFGRDPAKVLLTSAEKRFDVATYNLIESLVDGSWTPGLTIEDLASGGVDLAPFHRTNSQVPGAVRSTVRDVTAGIVAGTIPTLP